MNYYQGCAGSISPFEIDKFKFKGGEYIYEEKYDGIWCSVNYDLEGKVKLISRTEKEKTNAQLNSLKQYLEGFNLTDTVLVGELAFGSQKGTDHAKKYGHHKIDLFDVLQVGGVPCHEVPLLERKGMLEALVKKSNTDETYAKLADWGLASSAGIVKNVYDEIIRGGGEGLIIKDIADNMYRFGSKSPYWYKIKKHITLDYVITGYTKTQSAEYASKGWIGGVQGGLYVNGTLHNKIVVGSMDHNWRNEFSAKGALYLGRVMEVAGFEIFKSGAVRHPSFLRLRSDKLAKECVWSS